MIFDWESIRASRLGAKVQSGAWKPPNNNRASKYPRVLSIPPRTAFHTHSPRFFRLVLFTGVVKNGDFIRQRRHCRVIFQRIVERFCVANRKILSDRETLLI